MANLLYPKISDILGGQLRLEPLCRTRRGRSRPATRGVTISSSSLLVDDLEGEEPTPGGEGGENGGHHEEICSMTVSSMVTVPRTDKLVLATELIY